MSPNLSFLMLPLRLRHLPGPRPSVSPPMATCSYKTWPLIPHSPPCAEQWAPSPTHPCLFHPIESAASSGGIKTAHVQYEEQVGLTSAHTKTTYGLKRALPAQSVRCVALLRDPQPQLRGCKKLHPRFEDKTKQQCLKWNVLQVGS